MDNSFVIASLFRGIPKDQYHKVKSVITEVQKRWGVPVQINNDGDVTAIAGQLFHNLDAVIGVAGGSDVAGGAISRQAFYPGLMN